MKSKKLDWELIFSVDPCTDRTEELILGLRAEDERIKMLRFSTFGSRAGERGPTSPARVGGRYL